MCGISVIFSKNPILHDHFTDFISSLRKINHRGPDDEGVVLIDTRTNEFHILNPNAIQGLKEDVDPHSFVFGKYNLALGHKRLSIIDLSSQGHQPMQGKDGSWIVFNGEIYNYIEVREELKKLGCVFNTESDTEVILEAYRIWGKNCLLKFNGMWSICIWDASNKNLFISNDRFGVKPLYYLETEHGFSLVSEIKQISCFRNNPLTLNTSKIKDFLDFGYSDVDETTMYNGVYRFKKSYAINVDPLKYEKNSIRNNQERYYTLKRSNLYTDEKSAINEFREILHDSVKIRMRCDVDFGFALSGGIDSSAILYTARNVLNLENMPNILHGFSAVFPGYDSADESEFVKIVSEDLPCKTIYSHPMDDFNFDAFEKHIYHQDEPITGTTFFAQWSIYQKVKESGLKILFNGQGADEVFAGYHHHFYRYCRQLLCAGKLHYYFSIVNQYAELKKISRKYIHQTVINELKLKVKMNMGISKIDNSLFKYWNKIDTLDEMLVRDFDTFQLPTFLRVDDRNSMAFGIESRHPFMDYRLVEFGYSLPNSLLIKDGWQKHIIRKSMMEMPESIRYRKDKKGFTTPQHIWLERYKSEFESYLDYNSKIFGNKTPSSSPYKNYVLGAWLKVNGF